MADILPFRSLEDIAACKDDKFIEMLREFMNEDDTVVVAYAVKRGERFIFSNKKFSPDNIHELLGMLEMTKLMIFTAEHDHGGVTDIY